MDGIAAQSRRRGVRWTEQQRRTSALALDLVVLAPGMIGYEEAKAAYELDAAERLALVGLNAAAWYRAVWADQAQIHRQIIDP